MAKKPKAPLHTATRAGKAVPQGAGAIHSIQRETPVWCIAKLQGDPPFGWRGISEKKLWDDILRRLRDYESMKWTEILGSKNHEVPVSGIVREARRKLEEMGLGDVEKLLSLRVSNKERIWGIRMPDGTVHLLWWDPKHEVWDDSRH